MFLPKYRIHSRKSIEKFVKLNFLSVLLYLKMLQFLFFFCDTITEPFSMRKKLYFIPFLCCFPYAIAAQVWQPTGFFAPSPSSLSIDSGASSFQNDSYVYLSPNWNYKKGKAGFSISLPLNVLLYDPEPKLANSKPGQLRYFDYDSTQDRFRVINYVAYGRYGEVIPGKVTASFYAGRLQDGRIGHGSIVNRYINNPRADEYNVGVQADLNSDYGGLQVFSNSLYSNNVTAVRGYVRPLAIGEFFYRLSRGNRSVEDSISMNAINKTVEQELGGITVEEELKHKEKNPDGPKKQTTINAPTYRFGRDSMGDYSGNDPWYNRLSIGYTISFDGKAPRYLQYNTLGSPVIDSDRSPVPRSTNRLQITGIDFEYRLLNLPFFELAPYIDINRISIVNNTDPLLGASFLKPYSATGTHYGAIIRIGNPRFHLIWKPELRRSDANYIPMYFDSFYEVERTQSRFNQVGSPTKLADAEQIPRNAPRATSIFHSAQLNLYSISFEFAYEDLPGKNNSRVFFGSFIPLGSNFLLSFYFTKKGFDGINQAFNLTPKENSFGSVELSWALGPIQVRLQNLRRYFFNEDLKQFTTQDEPRVFISSSILF